ncbi:hypothetical protein [Chryseobacterium jejuense]|uniref:hypothetical protein n=1 Tax=Chryseobacterium jejuense TaxID=445960 RepID=UPI001AE9D9AB|nr:hypothetical protein [Chryseobacterium jejuense]MBP2616348.1 hypothetical protein [Chryseobacterium jejuense]
MENLISIRNLSYGFTQNKLILKNVNIPDFINPADKVFTPNNPFPDEDNFVEILDKLKKY